MRAIDIANQRKHLENYQHTLIYALYGRCKRPDPDSANFRSPIVRNLATLRAVGFARPCELKLIWSSGSAVGFRCS